MKEMGVFKRIFKVGQAEAHALVDKLEDPIKLTEQGIRDMKKDLDKSLQALAEVKALAIRAKREKSEYEESARNFESKAMELLKRAESGQLEEAEADRLASEALLKKESNEKNAESNAAQIEQFERSIAQLDANVKKLKSQISSYESELKTLKARARVSESTKKINKSMAQVDSSGTVAMLERMKEKVDKEESLAEAYGEMANESKSVEEEIDKVLEDTRPSTVNDSLAEMKAKMKSKSS